MRKMAFIIFVYLAFFQNAQAATTALAESLLEYQAITNYIGAPSFTVIGPSEFIVDINRITRRVNTLGRVEYRICTRRVSSAISEPEGINDEEKNTDYIATLQVSPNPGIGPNIVTVLSIEPCFSAN